MRVETVLYCTVLFVYYLCKFYFPGCGARGAPQENIVAYKVLKVTDIYTSIYKGCEQEEERGNGLIFGLDV